ncbi:MAG: hypothetical protein R3F07_04095 [Opitutaceae bacterium]
MITMKAVKFSATTVLALMVGTTAWAQTNTGHDHESGDSMTKTSADSSSMMKSNDGMGGSSAMAQSDKMKNMMQMTGMSPAMMKEARMMMRADLSTNEPSMLLGSKDELGLTDKQVNDLKKLQKSMGKKARAILTEDQQKNLAELPSDNTSMMQMHSQMMAHMQKMQKRKGQGADGGMDMSCPMMEMMMGDPDGSGAQNAHSHN